MVDFEETSSAPVTATGDILPQPLLPRQASHMILETAGLQASGHTPRTDASAAWRGRRHHLPLVRWKRDWHEKRAGYTDRCPGRRRQGPTSPNSPPHTRRNAVPDAIFPGRRQVVLLIVPRDDEIQQRALAVLTALTPFDVCLLAVEGTEDFRRSALPAVGGVLVGPGKPTRGRGG